jgi:anti-sigma factor RsiW
MNDELRIPKGAHQDALAWMSRELDGELSERERVLLYDHLDGCPTCARVAAQMKAQHRVLAADARLRPPVGLVERIVAYVGRAGEPAQSAAAERDGAGQPAAARAGSALRLLRASAAFAAALLVLAGGVYVASEPRQAAAAGAPSLKASDPGLLRVLERWQKGRAAQPSFFELLLPSPPAKGR